MAATAYKGSDVSMMAGYDPESETRFPQDLDAFYNPDEDWLSDQLEQARMNRFGFYKRLQNSSARALTSTDDDNFRFQASTGSSNYGSSREKSISDGGPAVDSVVKVPEPHTSWRFYTSYDNGEWRRHAVPVFKSEDDIMKDGGSTTRKELSSTGGAESSLRRMRLNRPTGVDSLQFRRHAASPVADVSKIRTVDDGLERVKVELRKTATPSPLLSPIQRRRTEGGERVIYARNHPEFSQQPDSNSEYFVSNSASYTRSTSESKPAAAADVRQPTSIIQDSTKSQRPRIYGGFEEKIIIPTKYKTAAEIKEKNSTAVVEEKDGVSKTETANVDGNNKSFIVEKTVSKIVRNDIEGNSRMPAAGVDEIGKSTKGSREVKVVIVNSDEDISKRSEEQISKMKSNLERNNLTKESTSGGDKATLERISGGSKSSLERYTTTEESTNGNSGETKEGAVERTEFVQASPGNKMDFRTFVTEAETLFKKDFQEFANLPDTAFQQESDGNKVSKNEEKKIFTETINIWNPGKPVDTTVVYESSFVSGHVPETTVDEATRFRDSRPQTNCDVALEKQDIAKSSEHWSHFPHSDNKDKYISVKTHVIRDGKSDLLREDEARINPAITTVQSHKDRSTITKIEPVVIISASSTVKKEGGRKTGQSNKSNDFDDWDFEMAVKN